MTLKMKNIVAFLAIESLMAVLLCGCSSLSSLVGHIQYEGDMYKKTIYQVSIKSHDQVQLAATVFQPHLDKAKSAPLIIHAHGFGVWRVSSSRSLYAKMAFTGEAALEAWNQGYWVISYDHRGFGDSEGRISMMDPDKEVKDVSAIIDWAIANIPSLQKDETDYKIGMIGESYGGGAQLLASIFDSRIDAIIPVTTWYDLTDTIEPKAAKTLWSSWLYYGGQLGSGFDIAKDVKTVFKNGIANELTEEDVEKLKIRSPSHYCDQEIYPNSDALFIQAFSDTALSAEHAIKNMNCFANAGRDYQGVLIQNGHNMPITDGLNRMPFFSIDEYVHCAGKKYRLIDVALSWWDQKLRGSDTDNGMPELCVTLNKNSGLAFNDSIDVNNSTYSFSSQPVQAGLAGITEWVLKPITLFADLFYYSDSNASLTSQAKGGTVRPRFIPLVKAESKQILFGTPSVEVQSDFGKEPKDPILIFGLGLKKAGNRNVSLVNYQVKAVVGGDEHSIDLPMVSAELNQGDTLGLLVYGYHSHYLFRGDFWPTKALLSGSVMLPLEPIESFSADNEQIAAIE